MEEEKNETRENIRFEIYQTPDIRKLEDDLTSFYFLLGDEKLTFNLPLEKVLDSSLLIAMRNEDEHICGICALRPRLGCFSLLMVVLKDYQAKGYGRTLLEKLLENSTVTLRPIFLTVMRANIRARKLYRSEGFVILNRYRSDAIMMYNRGPARLLRWPLWVLLGIRNLLTGM